MLKKREREKLNSEINIVPLTDVTMVLLIIFMVTTPFIMQGNIKINLPSAQAASDNINEKNIVIGVTADGGMYLDGKMMADENQLTEELKKTIAASGNNKVIIEGDKMALHGNIVKAMGAAKNAGAEKLAISTIPEANVPEKAK
jgi:biopolymer transport protein ExbD